jgi:hypothetical protein
MSDGPDRNRDARSKGVRIGEDNLEARLGGQLNELFAAYRDACPDPEPSPDFTPRLWARIEGRRQTLEVFAWRRWAEAFLSLAAVACLLIVVLQVVPPTTSAYFRSTYIDQLSEDDGPEHMLLQDVAYADTRPSLQPAALREAPPEGNSGR